jgi:choice-of-anchor C domain-containing protein
MLVKYLLTIRLRMAKMHLSKGLFGFIASMLLAGTVSANAAIVVDGNFNDPLYGGSFQTFTSGAQFGGPSGDAWTVISGSVSVDLIGSYWAPPTVGGGSVDLDGNSPGGISQTINAADGSYLLSFYLSGNPDGQQPQTKTVQVTVGGSTQTFTYELQPTNTKSNMAYVLETLAFTLTGGQTTLTFQSLDPSNSPYGPVIGGVAIAAVPEPATWAMIILGFFGIGFLSYRRRGGLSFRLV